MNDVARNWVEGETGKNVTSVPPAPTKVGRVLDRQIFTTSRLADFASRSELEGRPAILRPSGRKSS